MSITKYYCTNDKTELIEIKGIYKCLKCKSEFCICDNTIIVESNDIKVILGYLYIIKTN